MDNFEILRRAIEDRILVRFLYQNSTRIAEPHLVGRNKKGNDCLSAFQISGGSGVSFRAFLMHDISKLEMLEETFEGPRSGYNPNDTTMSAIYFCL